MMKFIMMTSDAEHTKKLCEESTPETFDISDVEYDIIELNDEIDLNDMSALGKMIGDAYTRCKESILAATNHECVNIVIESKIPSIMTLATSILFADLMAGIDDMLCKFTSEHTVFVNIVINDNIVAID